VPTYQKRESAIKGWLYQCSLFALTDEKVSHFGKTVQPSEERNLHAKGLVESSLAEVLNASEDWIVQESGQGSSDFGHARER
jgi:hypothetical protein